MQVQYARQLVSIDRARALLGRGERLEHAKSPVAAAIAHNTVQHNIDGAVSGPELDRPMMMVNVITSIERVYRALGSFDVLSIGPRNEIEIFGLIGAGFSKDRIKALDLFTYSPLVEAGDMHAMPYADNSFDIIIVGWVLPYSRDHKLAAAEILRVARNRAIVAIAADFSDASITDPKFKGETTHTQSCAQILSLFGDHVGPVYFRHDPQPPATFMSMPVFEIRK